MFLSLYLYVVSAIWYDVRLYLSY